MTATITGVVSIKGGVGKTTTIINLANTLSNNYKQRVLVVDANFSAPNLRTYLGLEEPKFGIHEMLQKTAKPNETIYETPYGFHILPAKINNTKPTKVSDLKNYIDKIKVSYDFILLDSSPNITAEMIASINASDNLIIVLNPDYATVNCTLRTLKIIKDSDKEIQGIIVNNIYKSKNEIKFKEIENITKEKIIGQIPHHIDIREEVLIRNPLKINARKEYGKEYLEIGKFIFLSKNPKAKLKLKNFLLKNFSGKNRKKIIQNLRKST